jgi:hypothetical protein
MAHLLAAHSSATPKQAKEPFFATPQPKNNDINRLFIGAF